MELSDDGDGLDGWMEVCIRCNKPGEMTCCDRCPRAYHSHCLEKDEINENNEWKCPGCFMDDDMLVKVEQKGAFDMVSQKNTGEIFLGAVRYFITKVTST